MGVWNRLRGLDQRVLYPRDEESRRDFLARRSKNPLLWGTYQLLLGEVIELHDRVTALETRLAALEGEQ